MRLLLAAFALSLTAQGAVAQEIEGCECLWQGPFVDVQAETELVISGTVDRIRGNAVDVTVDRLLRGDEGLPVIRIWMKAADYCRPEVERFPIGSTWVMALHRIDEVPPGGFNPGTPNISYGRVGDYRLSACGGYFLSRSEDLVSGNLVSGPRWDYAPKMNPILIDLVSDFVNGSLSAEALTEATKEDPALRDMMLDTKAFLRGDPELEE
ncbi:MAG: delta-aminolevulinic acid dehydratase [Pseudomonadota bacterium]